MDPTDVHAKTPLAEHAADYRRYLISKANTPEYVAKIMFRLTAVLDGCRFIRIADLQSSRVMEFLAELRRAGKGIKTVNDYQAAIRGFTRWLWRDKRTAFDALAGLAKLSNPETDIRHARREFQADELRRLLDTRARARKPFEV